MPTLRQLISSVRHRLAGVGSYTDAVLELTANLPAGETTIPVDDASRASAGLYEIGLEKIRVKSVDASAGTLTAYTFGRGYEGTPSTLHQEGSEITRSPLFPASTIAAEINGVLGELYPYLHGVKSLDVEYTTAFVLPDDAVGIVAVYVSDRSDTGWHRIDRWLWEPSAGQALALPAVSHGTTIRVVYATRPILFDLEATGAIDGDFATITGLDSRVADLLVLGVGYRLAPFADMGNLLATGQEARSDPSKQPGRGASLARLLYAEFQQRLIQEQAILHKENPIRVHKER